MSIFRKKAVTKYIDPLEPIPIGQVVEGNAESDWSEWEDSVAFQDSQISGYYEPTVPIPIEPAVRTTDSASAEDAYAFVTRNSP